MTTAATQKETRCHTLKRPFLRLPKTQRERHAMQITFKATYLEDDKISLQKTGLSMTQTRPVACGKITRYSSSGVKAHPPTRGGITTTALRRRRRPTVYRYVCTYNPTRFFPIHWKTTTTTGNRGEKFSTEDKEFSRGRVRSFIPYLGSGSEERRRSVT